MKTESQVVPWWTNLSSNAERNRTEKEENISPALKTDGEDENKTVKLLESYKRIIDKNTELMRLLMTNFKTQAEQLDKFMIV